MTAIAQTSMIAACLAVLIYVAVITTGNYFATQENIVANQNPLSEQQQLDDELHRLISSNLNYSHIADTSRDSQTVLLNGINLNTSEFIFFI
jgi:cell division protein FtsL